jgi:SulP family sulfate permease
VKSRLNLFRPRLVLPHVLKNYKPSFLQGDFRAGTNVALLAIPQGMAYALVAGLPIHYGLLGSAVAAIMGSLWGGGKFITLGPTNATAVLLFGAFASMGLVKADGLTNPEGLLLLPLILIFSGLFLVIACVFRISFIVQFVSRTVITAYVTAAACLIIANQSRHVLGIVPQEGPPPSTFLEILLFLIKNFASVSLPTLSLSLITAAIYLFFHFRAPKFPNVAISLILSSLIAHGLEIWGYSFTTLDAFAIGKNLISPPQWELGLTYWNVILSTSFAVCLLCLLEGLSIGKSLSARAGARIDTNQETFSIGLGNVGCALFSGMPASGSLTRSTLNVDSGALSNVANLITGVLIIIGLLLLGDLVSFVPLCSLSTLVIFIGLSLIKARQIKTVSKATRSDGFAFAITLVFGLTVSLQIAIFAGVLTSVLLFLRKVAQPQMIEYGYTEEGSLAEASPQTKRAEPEVSIVHVEGELFFAAADLFYEQIRRVGDDPNIKVLVLKMLNAHHLDATSVLALEELLDSLGEKDCHVLLCEIRKENLRILKNSGVLSRINRRNIFPYITHNPTLSTAKAIRRAKALVEGTPAKVTIFSEQKR